MSTGTQEQEDRERNIEIAKTINEQINAQDFWARARWGWKTSIVMERGLMYKCLNARVINIFLEWDDTYTISIMNTRKKTNMTVYRQENVYFDQLIQVIDEGMVRSCE